MQEKYAVASAGGADYAALAEKDKHTNNLSNECNDGDDAIVVPVIIVGVLVCEDANVRRYAQKLKGQNAVYFSLERCLVFPFILDIL